MTTSRHAARLGAALLAATAATVLVAGAVLAHPESEGDHPSGCIVTVSPASVGVGQQFTVSGNFGGASIFIVAGADASPAEDATADATTPEGDSFSVTFTAEESDVGEHTVLGTLPESECGDSDDLTVTTVPNTAVDAPSTQALLGGLVLLLAALALAVDRVLALRRVR
jgi:hypothetical protein